MSSIRRFFTKPIGPPQLDKPGPRLALVAVGFALALGAVFATQLIDNVRLKGFDLKSWRTSKDYAWDGERARLASEIVSKGLMEGESRHYIQNVFGEPNSSWAVNSGIAHDPNGAEYLLGYTPRDSSLRQSWKVLEIDFGEDGRASRAHVEDYGSQIVID
ncbi:MAG: hypothetical protein QOJ65_571 [Fimbriimonadaceae bacterium]|nr:hypothetical protein [Fimbriimonadaceae bacterium]